MKVVFDYCFTLVSCETSVFCLFGKCRPAGVRSEVAPLLQEPPSGLKMVAMNNYLGMGIDAELSLAFHLAREENPEKCTSRCRAVVVLRNHFYSGA